MKSVTRSIFVPLCLALLSAIVTSPTFALYHMGLGRFAQRDPHGTMLKPVSLPARDQSSAFAATQGFMPRDRPNPQQIYPDGINFYPNHALSVFRSDPTGMTTSVFDARRRQRQRERREDRRDELEKPYVIPGITIYRWAAPGGHQWLNINGHHVGYSGVDADKHGGWSLELSPAHPAAEANRSRLQNPNTFLVWEVRRKKSGRLPSGTCCVNASAPEIASCIESEMIRDNRGSKKFNILCNNCRHNSIRILGKCCARRGRLVHNPLDQTDLDRWINDSTKGPTQYLSR